MFVQTPVAGIFVFLFVVFLVLTFVFIGLYASKPTEESSDPSFPGVFLRKNVSPGVIGPTTQKISIQACNNLCVNDPECKMYYWYPGNSGGEAGNCQIERIGTETPGSYTSLKGPERVYYTYPGVKFQNEEPPPFATTEVDSIDSCQNFCNNMPRCVGVVFNENNQTCEGLSFKYTGETGAWLGVKEK